MAHFPSQNEIHFNRHNLLQLMHDTVIISLKIVFFRKVYFDLP